MLKVEGDAKLQVLSEAVPTQPCMHHVTTSEVLADGIMQVSYSHRTGDQ